MTDFFPAGRTRYPGRNAEEKTIHFLNTSVDKQIISLSPSQTSL